MKDVGSWDALHRVTVEECILFECKTILEAVAEGKLHYLV